MGEILVFQRPDGGPSEGYLVPAADKSPALILIQEWWGINAHIRNLAERFAREGFHTLAPDLYHGRLASSADEARHLMDGLDFPDATHQDIHGAVGHMVNQGRKVAVLGFCMGGALSVAAAVHVPGLAAAVCFYGLPPKSFADPAQIRIPFQGHFATQDDWITPELVRSLEHDMRAAGRSPQLFHYNAQHAFFNNARPEVYDAAAAQLAWQRSIAFLRQHLS